MAIAGSGDRDGAIRVLEATLKIRPNDAKRLRALSGYLRETGQLARAAQAQQQLDTLLRD